MRKTVSSGRARPSSSRASRSIARGLARKRRDLAGEPGVVDAELLDLLPEALDLPALVDEVEDAAVAEDGADDERDEGDDGAQDPGLPLDTRLSARDLIPVGRHLILCFND